jgi:UDP-N-acetylmuramyl pentapeptide phosphotransferase/UDP-N-acetylglucosamine-1-phosphate transferase
MIILILCLMIAIQWWWWLVSRFFWLVDKPHLYADTKGRKPIPTLQGIFVTLALVVWYIVYRWWLSSPLHIVIIVSILFLCCIGTIDDVAVGMYLHPWPRFLAQVLISGLIVWIADLPLTIGMIHLPARLGYGCSVAWFVLCINSLNRFDGINWQASWMSAIWFGTIALLLWFVVMPSYPLITPEKTFALTEVIVVSFFACVVAIVASIIEWRPSWLVRDAGTLVYGFLLAYVSLAWWAKVGTIIVVLLPVILDALWVCAHRIFVMKKAPRKWDYTHLHHRLQWLWRSKREAKVFVWVWGLMMMTIMLIQWDQSRNKLVIFGLMATLFWWVNAYLFWVKKLPVWFDHAIRPSNDESES